MIPAKEVLSFRHKGSKWPTRDNDNRIEPICLPHISPGFYLEDAESIFTIGSCFARNIEEALAEQGFSVPALSFRAPQSELFIGTKNAPGILNKYTPHSMLNEVNFAFGNTDGAEFLLQGDEGQFLDGQLHTNVPVGLDRALERRKEVRELYRKSIEYSRVIIITLGLIECWWDDEAKIYLNETPNAKNIKRYPDRFYFRVLDIQETVSVTLDLVKTLRLNGRNDQRVLLTVSPVPFRRTFSGKDAIIANCLSKSSLRVAAETVTSQCDWVDYYPSFESVTHSNRDVAWEDDLVHVKNGLVAENIKRMIQEYASKVTLTASS